MDAPNVPLDKNLLAVLVCPMTKQPLEYCKEDNTLISRAAKLVYPVRNGIPIMLPDEATPLSSHS